MTNRVERPAGPPIPEPGPGGEGPAFLRVPLAGIRAGLRRLRERVAPRPDGPAHLAAGVWGEEQAERLLRRKGYRILGRRVRVGTRGELDLVVRHGQTMVFVEVKTRSREDFGRPGAAVDRAKRGRLTRAAVRYALAARPRPEGIRFDIVEVIGAPDRGAADIRHIENAFSLDRRTRLPW